MLPEPFLITLNGLFTLAILSFLFRDNPVYKLAEHLFIGVAAGYYVAIEWHNVFLPNLWRPMVGIGEGEPRLVLMIPFVISLLMFSRFVPRYTWLSRWSLALMVGAYAGLAVIGAAQGDLIRQVEASMVPVMARPGTPWFDPADSSGPSALNNLIVLVGMVASLAYFFFSREHRGSLGGLAKLGIWFLMLSFGASYGFTVMARYSLIIGRLDVLIREWPVKAPAAAVICMGVFVVAIAVAAIMEIMGRSRPGGPQGAT